MKRWYPLSGLEWCGWSFASLCLLSPILFFSVILSGFQERLPPLSEWLSFKDIGSSGAPHFWSSPLYGDRQLSQRFLCNFNGLYRVGFYVRLQEKDQPLQLVLILSEEGKKAEVLRKVAINQSDFRPSQRDLFYTIPREPQTDLWRRIYFYFEPIQESKNHRYSLTIENPSLDSTGAVHIGLLREGAFNGMKEGSSFEQGEEIPGKDLAFTTYCRYQGNIRLIPILLINQLKQDSQFFHFYLASLVFFCFGIIFSLKRR